MKLVLMVLLSVASIHSYGAEGCAGLETTLNRVNPHATAVQYGHPLEDLMIPYYSTEGAVNDPSYLESMCLTRKDLAESDSPLNTRQVTIAASVCGIEIFKCNIDDNSVESASELRRRKRRKRRRKAAAAARAREAAVQTFSAVSDNPPSASAEDSVGIVSENPVYAELIDGEVVYYSGAPVE